MRLVLSVALALTLVPAAASAAELPPDVEECAQGESRRVVERFVRAFNSRNFAALDRVFSPPKSFNWYSTNGPGARRDPYNRATLMAYFRSRQRLAERLRLVWMSRGGNSNGYGHFGFHVERRARGLPPTVYQGKGAVICAASGDTISVWSFGGPVRS